MKQFTDKQNEVFAGLFSALKSEGKTFEVNAFALLDFDDENFTKLYSDISCHITGTEQELEIVEKRAIYLGLK